MVRVYQDRGGVAGGAVIRHNPVMRIDLRRLFALVLSLACAASAAAQNSAAAKQCAANGGKVETFDTQGGAIRFCRLSDRSAIEEATLLRGKKSKAAGVFKQHKKLREAIESREDADGTVEEHCEIGGGKVAVFGPKGAEISACIFLDRSSIDARSLFEGPERRRALAKLLK